MLVAAKYDSLKSSGWGFQSATAGAIDTLYSHPCCARIESNKRILKGVIKAYPYPITRVYERAKLHDTVVQYRLVVSTLLHGCEGVKLSGVNTKKIKLTVF